MRDYSFRFLDQLGRSQPGEHARFMDDQAATDFARDALVHSHSVEVWRGKECVIRIERTAPDFTAPLAPPLSSFAPAQPDEPSRGEPHIIAIKGAIRPVA